MNVLEKILHQYVDGVIYYKKNGYIFRFKINSFQTGNEFKIFASYLQPAKLEVSGWEKCSESNREFYFDEEVIVEVKDDVSFSVTQGHLQLVFFKRPEFAPIDVKCVFKKL